MNGKKAKAVRRAAPSAPKPRSTARSSTFWTSRKSGLVAIGVLAIISASFVLPDVLSTKTTSTGAKHAMALGVEQGTGLPVGSSVPSFSERDLSSRSPITSKTVYGHRTLLFFSEGVMCQACFEQIQDLQQLGAELERRGIQLISITPDSPSDLRQAVAHYGITTPVISDSDRSMSDAFNTLGQGMHDDTPGHAFALIDKGKVLWYRDYWLAPYRMMYVQPKRLLAEIPDMPR